MATPTSNSSQTKPSEEEVEYGFSIDEAHPEYQICLNTVEKAMRDNETIHKLIDGIESLGCELPKSFIACRKCEGPMTGGFISPGEDSKGNYVPQIIICQNKIKDSITFQTTIAHELVHAYDTCRAKLDTTKCIQHACTEIRASSISGECGILSEMMRGRMQISKGLPDCVKRRATLSLQGNPHCQSVAAQAVEAAFEKCFYDYSPLTKDDIKRG